MLFMRAPALIHILIASLYPLTTSPHFPRPNNLLVTNIPLSVSMRTDCHRNIFRLHTSVISDNIGLSLSDLSY